jgi:hypothetical protein
METKSWYLSKVLWINLIAIVCLAIQTFNSNFIISPEIQAGVLGIINLILRATTNLPLDWNTPAKPTDSGTPFSPPPQGGFVQLALLLMLISLALIGALVNGCATTSPVTMPGAAVVSPAATSKDNPLQLAGKSLLAVKSTIVVAATTTDSLCKAGKITPDKCAQAKAAYDLSKPAYDSAVDAYLLMSQGYGDPAAFAAALGRVQAIADNLLSLSGGVK